MGAKLLIATDIFGRSVHLSALAQSLAGRFEEVHILDPYAGADRRFPDEATAYRAFIDEGGLDSYTRGAEQQIASLSGPLHLLGFSAGASALWIASSRIPYLQVRKAWLFYSAQIRNHLACQPRCPVHLVFPRTEEHFEVDIVMRELNGKPDLTLEKTRYLHGFMNPLSSNFSSKGLLEYQKRILEEL
jgi:dienelactone hydrolase